jgi:hypothetical protein
MAALSVSIILLHVIPTQEEDSVAVGAEVVDAVVDAAVDEAVLEIVGDSVVAVVEVAEGDVAHHAVVGVDVVDCLHSKERRLHSKPRLSGTLISLI